LQGRHRYLIPDLLSITTTFHHHQQHLYAHNIHMRILTLRIVCETVKRRSSKPKRISAELRPKRRSKR
jgi:hypothetical protein